MALAKYRVPSFLTHLGKEEKERMMKEWIAMQNYDCMAYLKQHFEKRLDKLIQEEEKSSFQTWFQTKWNRATNQGKKQVLRDVIKDLTGSIGENNEL